MKRHLIYTMLCLAFACSAERSASGSSQADDDDDELEPREPADVGAKSDAMRGSSSGDTSQDRSPSIDPKSDDGRAFAECAEKRFDAERGPRGSNIVWVIDNSGSMDEEATAVQQNLNRFVQSITAAGLEDYRVVLITESGFVQVPAPLGSDAKHFMQIDENVKSDEPLSDLLARYPDFEKFLLPGVVTHFVTVTDDESEITAENFVTNMKLKNSDFRVHSVASPPGDMSAAMQPRSLFDDDEARGCKGPLGEAADPGVRHWQASKITNGLTFSICTEDWSSLFSELAKTVEASAAVPCTVELPEPSMGEVFNPSLVNVVFTAPSQRDGERLPRLRDAAVCGDKRGWYYDDANQPTSILLCPTSCSAASSGGSLDVALGCETFVQ